MGKLGFEEVDAWLDPDIAVPESMERELSDILPRGYLSISQANVFLNCPRQWYLRYVEGRPTKTSIRMMQGVQVHQAVEKNLTVKLETGRLAPLNDVLDIYSTAFEATKSLIDDWEGQIPGDSKDLGIKLTRTHYIEAAPAAAPIAVEKEFHTIIKSEDGKIRLPIFGRIDSIQVQLEDGEEYDPDRAKVAPNQNRSINDLKVVTDKWGPKDLDNDLQFAMYAYAEKIYDVQVDQLIKGRAKTPRPRYEKLTGVITQRQLKHTVGVLEGVAKSIALGHFPMCAPDNWWCDAKFCPVWSSCRGKGETK